MEVMEITNIDELYTYKIPDEYYTDEYRLIDVQHIHNRQQIVYIFRDKNNKKVFYEAPGKDTNYYWYESASGGNTIEPISDLMLKTGNYKNRSQAKNCYESDVPVEVKHTIDYYLNCKGECDIVSRNIFYFDIEVYTFKDGTFPSPDKAAYPVNAISFSKGDGIRHVYLLKLNGEIDPDIDRIMKDKDFDTLTLFTDEITMMRTFLSQIRITQPDFICGWNVINFDMAYITTRMRLLKISMKELSPYGNVFVDGKRGRCLVTGLIILDQLEMYKNFTYSVEPSYKLENISQKVLGKGKQQYDGDLATLYSKDVKTFIEYSLIDSELLEDLENNLQHIAAQDELRKAATTTHNGALSTIGQADGLLLSSLKKKGLAAKNTDHSLTKDKLIGAYVFDPQPGLKSGILCDFDFTSLYPSIVNTWNIGPNTYICRIPQKVAYYYIYDREKLKNATFTVILDPVNKRELKKIGFAELEKIIEENNATVNIYGCLFKGHDIEESIYYDVIATLFGGRKQFKRMMFEYKTAGDKMNAGIYDCKQMAMKILMNSLYGVMSNEYFRCFNNELASSITAAGQELLKLSAVHCNQFMETGSKKLQLNFQADVENKMTYVVYGDTDSLFINLTDYLKKKGIEVGLNDEVNAEILAIQNYLNKELLAYACERHNIPLNRSMLELKNEFIFSKYYALMVKKKYAAQVIAQEGRPLNFVEIKGLETKRSDYSQFTKDMLENILAMILSDDASKRNIVSIESYVKTVETTIATLARKGDPIVTKSVSYSKPLAEYKTIPQHIKGMLSWNYIVHEDFRYGSRGKLFPCLGFDITKAPPHIQHNYSNIFLKHYSPNSINAIVIPEDVDTLPEYFIPDIKKIVSFSVNDRVDLLLAPLRQKVVNPLW